MIVYASISGANMDPSRQLALFAPYLRFCAIFLVFAYVFPSCSIVCLLRAAVALCVFARKNIRYLLFVSKAENADKTIRGRPLVRLLFGFMAKSVVVCLVLLSGR